MLYNNFNDADHITVILSYWIRNENIFDNKKGTRAG